MTARRTTATAHRVIGQLRHDRRTVALMLVVPCVLVGLLAWIYADTPVFDHIGAPLLGIFPFVVMFLVTSVATLRERTSGTLERLLSMPMAKLDLLLGYALAFGAMATVQAVLVSSLSLTVYGLDIAGPTWMLITVAVVDAVLGMALGLFVSAFATTEFQAVQFMPAFVLPQFLLCGLLVPRDQLPPFLHLVSAVLRRRRDASPDDERRDRAQHVGRPRRRRLRGGAGAGPRCGHPAPAYAVNAAVSGSGAGCCASPPDGSPPRRRRRTRGPDRRPGRAGRSRGRRGRTPARLPARSAARRCPPASASRH